MEPTLNISRSDLGSGSDRSTAAALAAVVCLALAVRVYGLDHESLWADEAFTWWWTRQPMAELWGPRAALETNPPLYFILPWLATRLLSDGEFALRLPSALIGTLGVAAVFLLGREAAGNRAGLVAALLTAIAAPHVYYSQEARGYALLSLLGTLSVLGCLIFLHTAVSTENVRRRGVAGLALYAASTTGALYVHNTAALLPMLINTVVTGWWMSRSRRWNTGAWWIGANLFVLAAWSFWLPTLVRQLGGADSLEWLAQPSLPWAARDFLRLYGLRYLPDSKLGQVLPGLLVVCLAMLACARRRDVATLLLGTLALGVPSLLLLTGLLGRPAWIERTLFWPLPLGLTLVAIAIVGLRSVWAKRTALAVVIMIALVDLGLLFAHRQKEPYREALATVAAAWRPGDALLFVPETTVMGATYYQVRLDLPLLGYVINPLHERHSMGMPYDALAMRQPLVVLPTWLQIADLGQLPEHHGRIWILYRDREVDDPQDVVLQRLLALGREDREWQFPPLIALVLIDFGPPRS